MANESRVDVLEIPQSENVKEYLEWMRKTGIALINKVGNVADFEGNIPQAINPYRQGIANGTGNLPWQYPQPGSAPYPYPQVDPIGPLSPWPPPVSAPSIAPSTLAPLTFTGYTKRQLLEIMLRGACKLMRDVHGIEELECWLVTERGPEDVRGKIYMKAKGHEAKVVFHNFQPFTEASILTYEQTEETLISDLVDVLMVTGLENFFNQEFGVETSSL